MEKTKKLMIGLMVMGLLMVGGISMGKTLIQCAYSPDPPIRPNSITQVAYSPDPPIRPNSIGIGI